MWVPHRRIPTAKDGEQVFEINDLVVYENGGVCRVEEIASPDFVKNNELYYTLQPLFDKAGTIYVKVENDRHVLRHIISKDEASNTVTVSDVEKRAAIWMDSRT